MNLKVTDDHGNQVVYIFQRAPDYEEHTVPGYTEVFLDPAGGSFKRNLFDDFSRIGGPENVGSAVRQMEFELSAVGTASLDDLQIGSSLGTGSGVTDKSPPQVTISSPRASEKTFQTSSVFLSGSASDDVAVAVVEVQVNGGPFVPAVGTEDWTADIALVPGGNTVTVRATDTVGNATTTMRTMTYVLSDSLALSVEGSGSVKPDLNGQSIELGKTVKLKAKPAANYVFAGWSGSSDSSDPALNFQMVSGATLTATFMPNPFVPVSGVYNGLFFQNGTATHDSSGWVDFKVSSKGAIKGKIIVGGKQVPPFRADLTRTWPRRSLWSGLAARLYRYPCSLTATPLPAR